MTCRTTKLGGLEFCMSLHAAQRAVDMALTSDDILDVLKNPVESYGSRKYVALCVRNDKIALAMPECGKDSSHRVIVTILPSGIENWKKAQEAGTLGDGRVLDERRYSHKNNPSK